jgi:predicted site-specific integrase-resolvase
MSGQELTTAQVAERLGVSAVTARLWCRRGLFPNAYEQQTPRGAVWMIPESDLKGFEPPKKTGRPRKEEAENAVHQESKKKGGRK